jgi:hypothetical protein
MRPRDPIPSLAGDINRVVLFGVLCEAPEVCELEDVCVLARRVEFLGPAPAWVHGPAGEIYDREPLTLADGSCAVGFSEDVWI